MQRLPITAFSTLETPVSAVFRVSEKPSKCGSSGDHALCSSIKSVLSLPTQVIRVCLPSTWQQHCGHRRPSACRELRHNLDTRGRYCTGIHHAGRQAKLYEDLADVFFLVMKKSRRQGVGLSVTVLLLSLYFPVQLVQSCTAVDPHMMHNMSVRTKMLLAGDLP